jgi:hypothetical protein
MEPTPEVRLGPNGEIAIRTGEGVTMPWYVFNPNTGGHYSNGEREMILGDPDEDYADHWPLMEVLDANH